MEQRIEKPTYEEFGLAPRCQSTSPTVRVKLPQPHGLMPLNCVRSIRHDGDHYAATMVNTKDEQWWQW